MLSTDAVARRLTSDGDLDISAGRSTFVAGVAGVAAGVRARLELIRGEWFWDRTRGLPTIENDYVRPRDALLGQAFDEAKARKAFAAAILDTPAVTRLLRLEIAWNGSTRKATVTWQARCTFGDTPVSVLEL